MNVTKLGSIAFTLLLAACGGSEHRIGIEPGDGGSAPDGKTSSSNPSNFKDATPGGVSHGDGMTSDAGGPTASSLDNLVVTLLERTSFASGEYADRYRVSMVIVNGASSNMTEISRVRVESSFGPTNFSEPPSCQDAGFARGFIPAGARSPIFSFELTFTALTGHPGEVRLTTDCGYVTKSSPGNPNTPGDLTLVIAGLYEDGAPFELSATAAIIDGR